MDDKQELGDIYNHSFDLLCESIRARLQLKDDNSILSEDIRKLELYSSALESNKKHYICNEDAEMDFGVDSYNYSDSEVTLNEEMDEDCSYEKEEGPKSNFIKALGRIVEIYSTFGDQSDNKTLRPPPVPVTEAFRRYNPEASNVFEFHKPGEAKTSDFNDPVSFSNAISSLLRDSIHTCLVSKEDFDKLSKRSNISPERLCSSFKSEKVSSDDVYAIMKHLFGWYFSGYYTGRMEALAQSVP